MYELIAIKGNILLTLLANMKSCKTILVGYKNK